MSNETPMITQKKWNAKLRELRVANERIAALTAERDGLQQSLIAEEDEYVKLLAECEDLKHDIARHVDIASKEASARIEAEARLATVRAETIERAACVADRENFTMLAKLIRALAQKEAGGRKGE